ATTTRDISALSLHDALPICGPKNTRIKVGALPTEGFCRIELIGVATTGANNLDFHLAFHLGRFHEVAENGVAFHIISNDGGFNGDRKSTRLNSSHVKISYAV